MFCNSSIYIHTQAKAPNIALDKDDILKYILWNIIFIFCTHI